MAVAFSSISTLKGAREINTAHLALATQDLGGKVATMISAINTLNTTVSLIQVAVLSANASGATFSSLSGVTFSSTLVSMANLAS